MEVGVIYKDSGCTIVSDPTCLSPLPFVKQMKLEAQGKLHSEAVTPGTEDGQDRDGRWIGLGGLG